MFESSRTYYLYNEPTDMRKSFHTLGAIVISKMGMDVQNGAGYIFINKRKSHLKMLLWEGDGFSLYYKRLEQGTFEHPTCAKNWEISYNKLLLIIRGINTKNIVKRKRYSLVNTKEKAYF